MTWSCKLLNNGTLKIGFVRVFSCLCLVSGYFIVYFVFVCCLFLFAFRRKEDGEVEKCRKRGLEREGEEEREGGRGRGKMGRRRM